MADETKDKPYKDLAEELEAHRGTMRLRAFCRLMGISNDTGYKWVRDDGLPAAKLSGTIWIDAKAAANWWRARTGQKKPSLPPVSRRWKGGEDISVAL